VSGQESRLLPVLLPFLRIERASSGLEAGTDARQVTVSGQVDRNRCPGGTDSGAGDAILIPVDAGSTADVLHAGRGRPKHSCARSFFIFWRGQTLQVVRVCLDGPLRGLPPQWPRHQDPGRAANGGDVLRKRRASDLHHSA